MPLAGTGLPEQQPHQARAITENAAHPDAVVVSLWKQRTSIGGDDGNVISHVLRWPEGRHRGSRPCGSSE
ncbi:MAG: hypothetical protein ACRDUA_21780, partial [Micromonosporaceae bacterium]